MKYKPEDYIDNGFYSDMDSDVTNHNEKLVKCRKPHICASCQKEIKAGDYALLETGFLYGEPVSCHTCTPCIDEWLEKTRQVKESEGERCLSHT